MKYNHIISLGSDCSVTENIERFYKISDRSLFSFLGWAEDISYFTSILENPYNLHLNDERMVLHFKDQESLDHLREKHFNLLQEKNVLYVIKLGERLHYGNWKEIEQEKYTLENVNKLKDLILPYGNILFITFTEDFDILDNNSNVFVRHNKAKNFDIKDIEGFNKIFEEFKLS
jgi:hypothetical protein